VGGIISLGGDHTIAVPLLRAINKKCNGPVSLVHFDAHLDTWDTYFGAPIHMELHLEELEKKDCF
jgi:agmatinase